VSLKFAITPSTQIYATYSRGFKSGVFNATGAAATATQPEILDSYEGGIKAEPASWLRTNLSVFYYNYKDLQVTARTPDERLVVQNAAAARLFGGELEITAVPTKGLEIRAAASYVDDKFTSFPRAVIAVPQPNGSNNSTVPADVTGKHLIRSPRYTLNLGVDYSTHVAGFGDVGFSGNVYHSAKYYWEFSNRLAQPAYTKINAQAWIAPWPQVRLGVWGENLTNAVIEDLVVAGSSGDYAVYQKPRSVGAFIDYQF
jgi:iron complex outermembrane receptor protein